MKDGDQRKNEWVNHKETQADGFKAENNMLTKSMTLIEKSKDI